MKRYIDAEPIEKFIENGLNRKENPFGWQAIEILAEVHYAPTADVEPVRHGHWIFQKSYYDADECICSRCGQSMTTHTKERMPYCPNCGARMDEKEEEK